MSKNTLSLIAAMGSNRVIGSSNELPWDLPDDQDWFRRQTEGKPFIMGRKSYQSPDAFVSSHSNFILTRQEDIELCAHCEQVDGLEKAVALARKATEEEIFIVGGASVYEQALSLCDKMYLTLVEASPEGDAFFPEYDEAEWKVVKSEYHPADERHNFPFTFKVFVRR